MGPAAGEFASPLRDLLPDLELVHTDIDTHPELSMHETLVVASRAWLARPAAR